MLQQPQLKNLPLPSVKPHPESANLLDAYQMQIYDRIIMAAMKDEDSNLATALHELAAVPIEERYIARVIAAPCFAFGDFDSACIKLDFRNLAGIRMGAHGTAARRKNHTVPHSFEDVFFARNRWRNS